MLAEIFLLKWEAELRAMEMAAAPIAPRFVPFKSETWQGSVIALRQRSRAPQAASIAG